MATNAVMRRPAGAIAIVRDGAARVAHAPAVLLGAWLVLVATTLPFAGALHGAIERDLGHSLAATTAAHGVNWDWWQEFIYRQPEQATTFTPSIIGGAVVLRNASNLLDMVAPSRTVFVAITVYLVAWAFFAGGIIDRYARRRRVGAHGFFAVCGVFFWRFLRLGVLAGLAYALVLGPLHTLMFDALYRWLTRDLAVERTAFIWRVTLYLAFLWILGAVMVVFDYAKVRAVVEDRRSMIGALAAAMRFVRRNATDAVTVFLVNVTMFVLVAAVYMIAAPGAQGGDGWLVLVLLVGQAYVLARLFVKLMFYASAIALFQDRLAHAGFTAAPAPVWPDSPAAEAIANAIPSRPDDAPDRPE
jgi:hypothetical protein